jgi:hypothetical protein
MQKNIILDIYIIENNLFNYMLNTFLPSLIRDTDILNVILYMADVVFAC